MLIYSGGRLPEVARDAREERRADRRARGAAARHGALRRERRLPPSAPRRATSASATTGRLRRLRLLPRRARDGRPIRSSLARKILSCVARVGQRFGAAHVANVLCGSDERAGRRSAATTTLSTFGLLRDAPIAEVRGYIEQLIAHGLLRQTDDAYPGAGLTAGGRRAAEGSGAPMPDLALARQRRPVKDRGAEALARRGRVVGGRRSRSVRVAARAAAADRARARRAALRHLPRHDAARDGAAEAADDRGLAPRLRRRREEGGGPGETVIEAIRDTAGLGRGSRPRLRPTAAS